MAVEQLILDPVTEDATNSQLDITGTGYGLTEQHYPQPPVAAQWASSVDTEGSRLASVKHENRQIQISLDVESPALLSALQAKLGKLHREGGTLQRTLTDGTVIVFDVLAVEGYDPSFDQAYVLGGITSVSFTLTCLPYGRGREVANVVDDFSANTIANYDVRVGAATLAVSGGQLVPSSTAQKLWVYNVAPYPFYDVQATLKFTTGVTAPTSAGLASVVLKWIDDSNYLYFALRYDGTLRIIKRIAGVETLATSIAGAVAASTTYWVRGRIEGNLVTIERWTSAPTASGAPATTTSTTLAGGDATLFGAGVGAKVGFRVTPLGTDERYDDFTIEPNVYVERTLPALTTTMVAAQGDMPARGWLLVTDAQAQDQALLLWGIESRNYSSSSTAALTYEAESCAVISPSATAVGAAGASGAGSNVVRNTNLGAGWSGLCYIGASSTAQTHIGTFRVFARFWAPVTNSGTVSVRCAWKPYVGATDVTNTQVDLNPTGITEGYWMLADLGQVTLPKATVGTQGWIGRIEAISSSIGDDIDVDWVMLVPASEGSGEIRGVGDQNVNANGSVQIRHDGVFVSRAGGYWTRPSSYEGDYLLVPPAGAERRTLRIITKMARGVLIGGPGTPLIYDSKVMTDPAADDITAQLFYTPRYLVVPAA